MLRKLFSAETTNAQVARRKEPLKYSQNQTTAYQTFMKITTDLDAICLDTISSFLFLFSLCSPYNTNSES